MRTLIALAACTALAAGPALAVVIPPPPKAPAKGGGSGKKPPAPKDAAPATPPPAPPNPLLVRQRGVAPQALDDTDASMAQLVAGQRWTVVAVAPGAACNGSLSIDRAQPDAASGLLRVACRGDRSAPTSFIQAATLVETGDSVVIQLQAAQGGAPVPAWRAVRLRKDSPLRMTGAVGQGPDAYAFTLMLDGPT